MRHRRLFELTLKSSMRETRSHIRTVWSSMSKTLIHIQLLELEDENADTFSLPGAR